DAHHRVLHLLGREHRRTPHAARGPTAFPRIPRGRALHLDVPTLPALALHDVGGPRRVLRLGFHRLPAGAPPPPPAPPPSSPPPPPPRAPPPSFSALRG